MPEAVDTYMVLRERFEEIRRDIPGDPDWVAVYCNGCGRIEGALSLNALYPKLKGWDIAEEFGGHDYCPACRREGNGWAGSFPKRR